MRKVEVTPYNKQWAWMYEEEANKLRLIFGEQLAAIHHIGSTSVPGLEAKPVIDIMPVVNDIKLVDEYNHYMQEIGYEPKGENGITGRRFFQKGGDDRTHHVHIFQVGNFDIERHLAFRDYLREHPKAVQEYGQLKQQLAGQFPYDIESYINGKNQLVLEIERKAMEWEASRK
ncbi:GrpB family protein [Paenibacillus jiagnxiensis]|uniref:GrpB family protein n=1 Tax=Paenibacillus jiagnxiensis TaxID=3228926 RepID=UPI0033B5B74D